MAAHTGAKASYVLDLGTNSSVSWLSGLNDEAGGTSRTFSLTKFVLNRESDIRLGSFSFSSELDGFFQPPTAGIQGIGGLGGFGRLSSDGSTVSGAIEVVPTPAAVLPVLFGMGAAAFCKKKREGEEELALSGAEQA